MHSFSFKPRSSTRLSEKTARLTGIWRWPPRSTHTTRTFTCIVEVDPGGGSQEQRNSTSDGLNRLRGTNHVGRRIDRHRGEPATAEQCAPAASTANGSW